MNSYRGVDGAGSMSSITGRIGWVQKKRRTGEEFPDDGKDRRKRARKEDEGVGETRVDIREQKKEKEERMDPEKKEKHGSQGSSQGVPQRIDLLI
jgi:hypothetical protein